MSVNSNNQFINWSFFISHSDILQSNDENDTFSVKPESNRSAKSIYCTVQNFQEFIPWNNSDNILNSETESLVRQLKDVVFLPLFFLIGFPANVINMAVFYKQGLKERINVCLFALSLTDALYMAVNMLLYGEQLYLQFTTKEMYGTLMIIFTNNNLLGFYGFLWISHVITAIIASERCFCILQPLRSQTVLRASTMAVIILIVSLIIMGVVFIMACRFRLKCAYNPLDQSTSMTFVPSEFYVKHQQLVNYLDAFVIGGILPAVIIATILIATIITTIKLKQAASWRAETSSSKRLSDKEIALTKMLVANSFFFIACVFPIGAFKLMFLFNPEMNTGRRLHNFFMTTHWIIVVISYVNSSFNIVFYYTMGSRYRQIFWQLFSKRAKKVSG